MRMVLPLPRGSPNTQVGSYLPHCRYPSQGILQPTCENCHLWASFSTPALSLHSLSSELPHPCFWAAQQHQGPIQLSTIPVLLFVHCSHHRDGNSISPAFIGPGPERQEPKGLFLLSPSLSPPTPSISCRTHSLPWLHPTTSRFANCKLCVTRPLHNLLLLPGMYLPWLHCLKTSSDITSFEKPL